MTSPKSQSAAMVSLLADGQIKEFNKRRRAGEPCDLRGVDLRHVDLRGLDAEGLDMRDSHLRQADLRGIDLRKTLLEGASIAEAKISGTYFPEALSAEEINLSLQHGTRFRYR